MTLLDAIQEGNVEAIADLLAQGLDPEGADPTTSPLLQALFKQSEPMVRMLLAAGADPNHSPCDLSPLMTAKGDTLTRLLVDAGARVHLESGLDTCDNPGYSLHDAALKGDAPRLRLLLNEGEGLRQLEAYDSFGHTPLGAAAQAGKSETLQVLLEHGADPNGCNPDQIAYGPLEGAAGAGSVECVRLLLEYGADPDHAWGLCTSGRERIEEIGGGMLVLLEEADRRPERRRLTAESVRRRLMGQLGTWAVADPELHRIAREGHLDLRLALRPLVGLELEVGRSPQRQGALAAGLRDCAAQVGGGDGPRRPLTESGAV